MKRLPVIMLLSLASLGLATAVHADSVAARMEVSALVPANCRLTVPPLSFGTYDPLVSNAVQPAYASAVVVVTCTRNTSATLSFDLGIHAAAGQDRLMAGPDADLLLRYEIYRDSAHTQSWRTGAESMRLLSTGLDEPQQLTVFGRIAPRQDVGPGAYSDVLTAAVEF